MQGTSRAGALRGRAPASSDSTTGTPASVRGRSAPALPSAGQAHAEYTPPRLGTLPWHRTEQPREHDVLRPAPPSHPRRQCGEARPDATRGQLGTAPKNTAGALDSTGRPRARHPLRGPPVARRIRRPPAPDTGPPSRPAGADRTRSLPCEPRLPVLIEKNSRRKTSSFALSIPIRSGSVYVTPPPTKVPRASSGKRSVASSRAGIPWSPSSPDDSSVAAGRVLTAGARGARPEQAHRLRLQRLIRQYDSPRAPPQTFWPPRLKFMTSSAQKAAERRPGTVPGAARRLHEHGWNRSERRAALGLVGTRAPCVSGRRC